jgi:hypothetical protein
MDLRGQHPDGLQGCDFLDPLLGHILHRALKTLDIGNANHPRLHLPWLLVQGSTTHRQRLKDS